VTLDFNRASNLPCSFTDYTTCPVAPADNRLAIAADRHSDPADTNR